MIGKYSGEIFYRICRFKKDRDGEDEKGWVNI